MSPPHPRPTSSARRSVDQAPAAGRSAADQVVPAGESSSSSAASVPAVSNIDALIEELAANVDADGGLLQNRAGKLGTLSLLMITQIK